MVIITLLPKSDQLLQFIKKQVSERVDNLPGGISLLISCYTAGKQKLPPSQTSLELLCPL